MWCALSFYDSELRMKDEQAFNEKDATVLAGLFTDDTLLVAPEGLFAGRQSIEERYSRLIPALASKELFWRARSAHALGDETLGSRKRWSFVQSAKGPVTVRRLLGRKCLCAKAIRGKSASPSSTSPPQRILLPSSNLNKPLVES